MDLDSHYELLSKLYLRLNGFLVSNLIIHSSDYGNSNTEIDIIAIRLPFHNQEDRKIHSSKFLDLKDGLIEILIADVKNKNDVNKVKFNDGLRKKEDSILKLLQWIGCYPEITEEKINEFKSFLNQHKSKGDTSFKQFSEKLSYGNFNFKFTFFCPQLEQWTTNGYKYIHFEEVSNYIWTCLNNQEEVDSCSRKYDYEGWNEFKDYVIFFKDQEKAPVKKKFEHYFKDK